MLTTESIEKRMIEELLTEKRVGQQRLMNLQIDQELKVKELQK